MIRTASPVAIVHEAQAGMRRSRLRRQLQAVAEGKTGAAPGNLHDDLGDVAVVIRDITAGRPMQSPTVQRLVVALKNSGTADAVVARLAAKSPQDRITSARITGALHMYEAVPWLVELLDSRDRSVADAASRALGRIGGATGATAVIRSIHRRGISRRLIAALARSAPDLFIEAALREPQPPPVRPALAIAAGLRRRHTAVAQLVDLLQHGSRRERVISCRALGWIRATTAIPLLIDACRDPDWKIRMSAAKGLGALRARSAVHELKYLQIDRNMRVRAAAGNALRRLAVGP